VEYCSTSARSERDPAIFRLQPQLEPRLNRGTNYTRYALGAEWTRALIRAAPDAQNV
jgi:hypothetical protein